MKKFFSLLLLGVLFAVVLSGCNGSVETESEALPSSSMNRSTAIPSPSVAPKITEDELCDMFELVFDACGSSFSLRKEQLTAELEALKSKADSSEMTWPKNYEDRYKDWRTNVIAERTALLTAEYDEIIAGRKCYTPGLSSQMTQSESTGLFCADYQDMDNDGMAELILLTCSAPGSVVLEAYQSEEGHAVKTFEQTIDLNMQGTEFDVVTDNENVYLRVSAYETHQGYEFYEYLVFGMEDGHFGVVTWLTHESMVEDIFAETYVYDIDCRSKNPDGSFTELTEDQYKAYQAAVEGYQLSHTIGLFWDEPTGVEYTGVLLPMERTPAKVEVNGQLLDLDAEAYAYQGNLMAPIGDVLNAMGVAVYMNADSSVVLASTKKDTLTISNWDFVYNEQGIGQTPVWAGDSYRCCFNCWDYYSDNKEGIQANISDDVLFATVDKIVPLFGAQAHWDRDTNTMKITVDIPATDRMSDSDMMAMVNFSFDKAVKIGEQTGYTFFAMGVAQYDGGLRFSQGKAIWDYYASRTGEEIQWEQPDENGPGYATNIYYVSVASDGTIVADG